MALRQVEMLLMKLDFPRLHLQLQMLDPLLICDSLLLRQLVLV